MIAALFVPYTFRRYVEGPESKRQIFSFSNYPLVVKDLIKSKEIENIEFSILRLLPDLPLSNHYPTMVLK